MIFEDYKDTWRARRQAKETETEEGGLRLVSFNVNEANFEFNYTKNAEKREVRLTIKRWEMEELGRDIKHYFESDMLKEFCKREDKELIKELDYLLEIQLESK